MTHHTSTTDCDQMQDYLIDAPMPAGDLGTILAAREVPAVDEAHPARAALSPSQLPQKTLCYDPAVFPTVNFQAHFE